MLKLNLNPEPSWLVIPGGVRVRVPPLDTAILRAVEYTAWRSYSALKTAANDGDDAAALDVATTARLEGAFKLARVRALAEQIIAWEGVTDEAGATLQLSGEALDAFAAHPLAGPVFAQLYDATVQPLVAEGNASGSSLPGDGAAATNTAPDAPPAVDGDAEPALPSGTPHKV